MTIPNIEHGENYVPALIIRRVAKSDGPITSPIAENFDTALLFADISGFTALTEGLAERGAVGMEELSQIISDYFGCLAEVIVDHGGDIVKFAGDAMLALWPTSETEGLERVTQRAAQCALAVQTAMQEFSKQATAQLELKVALGAGSAICMHVGGVFGRWELLIAGQPFLQVGRAGDHAKPGDVVISKEARALLGGVGDGEPLDDGTAYLTSLPNEIPSVALQTPPLTPQHTEQLLPYIPAAIREQLGVGKSGWHAELRRVSVLFVNLPGVTHTTPIEQAQRLMYELQTTIYRYEGSVNKLSVDDKGVTLIAVMGLPPFAHEDDPARALQVSLDLHRCLEKLGLNTAIGVTTGRAYCGSVGSPRRCEYTIMGDMVNLAARLMQAAPGSILCDAATYAAAPNGVEFEELEPLRLKGKAELIQAYHPLEPKVTGTTRRRSGHAMVGRGEEMALLRGQLEKLEDGGSGAVVVLEGDAGIGKSRLLEEFEDIAMERGLHTVIGEADSIERSTPYRSWRGILSNVLSLDQISDPDARRDHVEALLSPVPELHRLAPLLNVVFPLDLPENETTSQMNGEIRAENAHHLFLGILRHALGSEPLLIVLEDSHWKDSASWAFTRMVIRDVKPLLLVISTRPTPAPHPPEYSEILALPETRTLKLAPLKPEEALALACLRLEIEALPQQVAEMIIDRAGGNPYFTEQLAFALRDAGHILIENGSSRLAPGTDMNAISMPDTVEGVVSERIDRLTTEQQLFLKVASVVGGSFLERLLRSIHPVEAEWPNIADHLDALQLADLADLETTTPEPLYAFKSIITQQVAYNLMLFAQRRELHRTIAEWQEREFAADLAPVYPTLAHHYNLAEDSVKAIDYLEKAGFRAVDNYANEEAVTFFNKAISLDEETPGLSTDTRRARWHEQLGEAYYALGKHDESRTHLNHALTLMGNRPPGPMWRHLTGLLWGVLVQTKHRLSGHSPAPAAETPDPLLISAARANERLCQIYYMDNAKIQSMNAAVTALNFAERAGTSPELARSYANVSVTTALVTAYSLSNMYERLALKTGTTVGHVASLAYAHEVVGLYHAGAGHFQQAGERMADSIALADTIGDLRRSDEAIFLTAVNLHQSGRLPEARECYDRLYALGCRHGIIQVQLWGLTGRLAMSLLIGDDPEAIDLLDQLLSAHADLPGGLSRADAILAFGLMAQARMRAGDADKAQEAAGRVVRFMEESETISFYLLPGYQGLGEALTTLFASRTTTESRQERRMLEITLKTFRSFAMMYPTARPMSLLWRGVHARLLGREAKAQRLIAKCVDAASRLNMPMAEAAAHREMALLGNLDSSTVTFHREQARQLFTDCGATMAVRRLDRIAETG